MPESYNAFLYTVIMTEKCNLRCKYCYVHSEEAKKVITTEVIDALIEKVKERLKNNEGINLAIFGGEPLMAWDKLKYLIEKIENEIKPNYKTEQKLCDMIRATIFTNGTLLTKEKLMYLEKFPFVGFNFSLDGCKEANDQARIYANGEGTFDDVMNGIKNYAEVYKRNIEDLTFKMMISPFNMNYLTKTAKYFKGKGFNRISMSLVRDNVWKEEHLEDYERYLNELADYYIENINDGIFFDIFSLPILDYRYTSETYCNAGKRHHALAPDGGLYPCQRFYNNKSGYKIGDIFNGIDENNKWYKLFQRYQVNNFTACSNCDTFTKYNCTGQCLAAMYEDSGDMLKPVTIVCKLLKINYKVATRVHNKLQNNPEYQKTLNVNKFGG